jgi:hypothetical protein
MSRITARLAVWLNHDPRYRFVGWLFLRCLGIIYLAAFVSAALEIQGLVGAEGILPAESYLQRLYGQFGSISWLRFPTLFWLGHSDASLVLASYAGCVVAVLLVFGWRPLLSTVLLFVLYLSLFRVGQVFFNFQWDYLLLEAGFLAIFLALGPSRLLIFLFHWLLFRLRFLSGLAKVLGGDPSWSGLTALNHYFETQPLPHIGSWYAHQLPTPLLQAGTGFTLFVELVVPFFIFLPRPFRLTAAGLTIAIQLMIILTSNHNFINLLTIALCMFLLDDQALRRILPGRLLQVGVRATYPGLGKAILAPAGIILMLASSIGIHDFVTGQRDRAAWDSPVNWVRGWGQANVYHVFPSMQTERQELVLQGSQDGKQWLSYRFRYKPNSPDDYPAFIVPLHPRLDWMIWFIPPQHEAMRFWFERFLWGLKNNAPAITELLEHNPFAAEPPRYLRVLAYRYRFTSPQERAANNRVWHAELLGEFPRVPPRQP